MLLAHHKTFPTVKDQISFRLSPSHLSPFSTMVRSSISNTVSKSQPPLRKAPRDPLETGLSSLSSKRARQAFLSFAFPFFQASGDNNTKDFSESQEHPVRPGDAFRISVICLGVAIRSSLGKCETMTFVSITAKHIILLFSCRCNFGVDLL